MKIRVYYEDTDCGNVVYYANYLRYMERSRTELMREKGISLSELQKKGIWFVVSQANLRYIRPAHYDDLLDVESFVTSIRGASLEIQTTIKNQSGNLLVTAEVTLACTDSSGRAIRIPQDIKLKLS